MACAMIVLIALLAEIVIGLIVNEIFHCLPRKWQRKISAAINAILTKIGWGLDD